MTKSKRKRQAQYIRTVPEEECGPNFYPNLKHGLIRKFLFDIKFTFESFDLIHQMISEKENENMETKQKLNSLHIPIARHTLIEFITILDSYIGQALFHYQLRKLDIEPSEIRAYSKVDEGITECLKERKIPKELDKLRVKINHFRTLRNQFSHYKIGVFAFNAKQESFESFLKKLDGIDLKESQHCFIDGKAGVFLPYSLSSGKFLEIFVQDSDSFMKALVEFLFPTNVKKTFDFEN